MLGKLLLYSKLARFHIYTGYTLPFFTVSFGLVLATKSEIDLKLLLLFFVSTIICRGAGCVINDIFDRDLDKYVSRTKMRPLADGSLTIFEAVICFAILSLASLSILLTFNRLTIFLGIIFSVMIVIYPLMKRITYLPQLFLGLVFTSGAIIAYTAVSNELSYEAICMYFGCCAWVVGYDTIYAFMDLVDDKKYKNKSIAVLLEEKNYRLFLFLCYLLFIVLFITANMISGRLINYYGVLSAFLILYWQIFTLDITSQSNCMTRFKSNNFVGAVLLLSIL